MRKVKKCKLPKQFGCSRIVGSCCFLFGWMKSKKYPLAFFGNDCSPFIRFLEPMYSFISRLTSTIEATILGVLGKCGESQVAPSIVECIVIRVVNQHSLRGLKNKIMHSYNSYSRISSGVKRLIISIPKSQPFPLGKPQVVRAVYLSNQTARKWNLTIICNGHPQPRLSHFGGLLAQPMPLVYQGVNA